MSAWRGEPNILAPVSQGAELPAMIAEAAVWAERILLCVTAPHSERGSLPWWRELLARQSKCDGVHVRQGERAEPWLLHRLHRAGRLRLIDGGGPGVAAQLLMFARADELRVLLAHVSLERAVAGAAFGTLLSFRGSSTSQFGRACHEQVASSAALARVATGRELDVLLRDGRTRRPPAALDLPRSARIVSEPSALAAGLERLNATASHTQAGARSVVHAVHVRANAFGYRLSPAHGKDARFVLTVYAGDAWAAGNAFVIDDGAGRILLVWRGDLLGPSRSRGELVWAETRLTSFAFDDPARGLSRRVGLVAESSAPLGAQLAAFVRELRRLSDVFGIEPAPALGHVLADFATLSPKQRLLLAWRALIGAGELELGSAASVAAESLRAQGYLQDTERGSMSAAERSLAEALRLAADGGRSFDRPSAVTLRAIQPDPAAYTLDDWLECLLLALPEQAVVAQRTALHLTLDWARARWGLADAALHSNPALERALESAVASAASRGLLVRVGAGGVQRLTSSSPPPSEARDSLAANASEHGFVAGWTLALAGLEPLRRLLLARRTGQYGPREALDSVARRLGLTLERAQKLEAEAWRQIEAGSLWVRAFRARLARAFADARALPVDLLTLDDAWWQGIERHLELADALFENMLGSEFWRVEIGSPRRVFFARFSPAELERTLAALRGQIAEARARGEPAAVRALAASACSALDPGLGEYVAEALEAELDAASSSGFAGSAAPPEREPREPRSVASEAQLRLEDALFSVFRAAGTPLTRSLVADRLRQRIDVSASALVEQLGRAPFVQLDAERYGLLARDVPGGPAAISAALADVTETLAASLRPLDAARTLELVRARVKLHGSPELVRSLLADDPILAVSRDHSVSLRCWHARGDADEPPYPGIPASVRSRFEALLSQTSLTEEALARRLAIEIAELERVADSDDTGELPLARQLGDISSRLLEHVASEPALRRSAEAAVVIFLEAIAPDEDAFEAEPIDAQPLSDARAVLAAVLRWLGLDWLARPLPEAPSEPPGGAFTIRNGSPG